MTVKSTIIILSWNGRGYLRRCLSTILPQVSDEDEVLLVDNASTDGTVQFVKKNFPKVKVVENAVNKGVAGGWNTGVEYAEGDLFFFINQDCYARSGWLANMKSTIRRSPLIGVVGCKLVYPDGKTIQHAGGMIEFPSGLTKHIGHGEIDQGQYDEVREVEYVTGAAFGLSRKLLTEVGPFDNDFYPAYFEDVDLCVRVREAGYFVLYQPKAAAIHYHGSSLGIDSEAFYYAYHINRLRFVIKYAGKIDLKRFVDWEIERIRLQRSILKIRALKRAYHDLHNKNKTEFTEIIRVLDQIPVTAK